MPTPFLRPFRLALAAPFALLAAFFLASPATAVDDGEQPNILWIVADDLSPALGSYGDDFVDTPHLDRLASEGVRYTHAFATAPACSPSRACLINGVIAPVQGAHNMRSAFPLPEEMTGFPSFLREKGYYTSNNVKTDYNSANWETIIERSWDESSDSAHWRKRPEGEPFFSIFNLMTTHQSRAMVWPRERFVEEVQSRLSAEEIHDPDEVPLPPYYPDTPVVRRTLARYYDCISVLDQDVGKILAQLEEDGLAEDTIVFFYSDHGSGIPRHKRALLDTGLRVPLIVRFPEKWQHLAPSGPGTAVDRLVSFEDFGPTVLSLAGAEIPGYMQGRPFLGAASEGKEPREYVFGHRDRIDEAIDLSRSIRDGRYLYIRNYHPHLGYHQPTAWPDSGEVRREFDRLAEGGTMTPAQWHYAGPTRWREELYDCEADPLNLHNLAEFDHVEHRPVLERMRKALRENLVKTRDLGFIPEAEKWERIGEDKTPMELGREMEEAEFEYLIEAAERVGAENGGAFLADLAAGDAALRYWAAVGLVAAADLSGETFAALEKALEDPSPDVRIEAAHALARHGYTGRAVPVLIAELENENLSAVVRAARTIELLGPRAAAAVPAMRAAGERLQGLRPEDVPATVVLPGDVDLAMFAGFSVNAFLEGLEQWNGARPSAGQGILVGEVAPDSALAQVRLTRGEELTGEGHPDLPGLPGVVEFSIRPSSAKKGNAEENGDGGNAAPVLHKIASALPERDHIARVAFENLDPGTEYRLTTRIGYHLDDLAPGPEATFRTLPGEESTEPVRFAVVTGMNYAKFHGDNRIDLEQHRVENNTELPPPYDGPDKELGYPALESILAKDPDFLVGTGDNVYYDTPDDPRAESIPQLRQKWHEQFRQPRYRELFARVPTYWMIDDHDHRIDDGDNSGDYHPSPAVAEAIYREQLPVAPAGDAESPTYRTHRVNRDLQLWFPEGRLHRSPNAMEDGPDKSIWGAEQREWLQRTLAASDATFKLLVSPTPLVGPDDKRKTDNHTNLGGFRHERDHFFAWLTEEGLVGDGFYLVCGDRHWQYHARHPSGVEEFACGALIDANARLGRAPGDPESTDPEGKIQQLYTQDEASGGFLLIETVPAKEGEPAALEFRFHDEKGEVLHEHRVVE